MKLPPAVRTFIVTGIALFMVSLDNLIVTNALPSIRADLGTGLEGLEWTVNAYTLSFAVLLLTGAAVADRYGRRKLFLGGLAVFTLASAAAAVAPGIGALIAARAIQGVGAAIVTPLTLTILAAAIPAERRGLAIGAWSAMSGLGVALGPIVGGAVTQYASWQWIFWINVPVGVALLALAPAFLRESHGPAKRLDPVGTGLITLGLFGIVLGLVRADSHGWTSVQVLVALIGGAVVTIAFVAWELRTRAPMLPMTMFRSRGFSMVNVVSLLMSFGMFGAVFLIAQFLQGVQHMTPLGAGVATLPWTAMPVLVSPLTGLLINRIGARNVIALALASQSAGLGWLAAHLGPDVAYLSLVPGFVLCGIGMGLVFPPIARLVLGFAPAELTGVASGVSNTVRQFGTVLGIAVLGTIFSSNGSMTSPSAFIAGVRPAVWVGAAMLAIGVVAALVIPRRLPAAEAPKVVMDTRQNVPTEEPALS